MNDSKIFGHIDTKANDDFSQAIKKMAIVGSIEDLMRQKQAVQLELEAIIQEHQRKSHLLSTMNTRIDQSKVELECIDLKIQSVMTSKLKELDLKEKSLYDFQSSVEDLASKNMKRSDELSEEDRRFKLRDKEMKERLASMDLSLRDSKAQLALVEKDLKGREAQLSADRVAFEKHKLTISDDITKQQALVKQNTKLLKQIEAESKGLDSKAISVKAEIDNLTILKGYVDRKKEELALKEDSLRKFEDKLKHRELEYNGMVAELSLEMRKNHLHKVINADKRSNA